MMRSLGAVELGYLVAVFPLSALLRIASIGADSQAARRFSTSSVILLSVRVYCW